MGVECKEDCLICMDGKKLLCHVVRVKREETSEASKGLYVRITETKKAKRSKGIKNNERLLILTRVPILLGP